MQMNQCKGNDLRPAPVTKCEPLGEMSMAFIEPVSKPSSSLMAEPSYASQ